MKARVELVSKMKFKAVPDSGHVIYMDAAETVGGEDSAARPLEHFLVSIAGCTGMDVVSILRKMQVKFDSFYIEIEAERAETHPRIFKEVNIKYVFQGSNIDAKKIERAIELSQEKYCSASAMVRAVSKLNYSFEIL